MPKTWVVKNKLKSGDLINVDEGSAELILSPNSLEQRKKHEEITIEIDNKNLDFIKVEIVSAYLDNYNTIEIIGKDLDKYIIQIKQIVRNLTGLEIMEQTSTRLVARDLININEISIQNIIRRMDMITRAMIDETILCLDKRCGYKNIEHRDVDVNRLYYLGFRTIKNAITSPIIAKKLNTNAWRLHSDKMVMSRIEEIADRQKRMCPLIAEAEFDEKINEEYKLLYGKVRQRYHEIMKAYYNNDKQLALNIEITTKGLLKECDKFFEYLSKRLDVEVKKGQGKPNVFSKKNILPAANMMEFTKATAIFIRCIARTILNMN